MSDVTADVLTAPIVKPKSSRDDWTMRAFMGVIGLYLLVALALPLYTMLSKSLEDHDGLFIGIANYIEYFSTPALAYSINNSLYIAVITTVITVTIAFTFAYALTRSCIPYKGLFKSITMIPRPGERMRGHQIGDHDAITDPLPNARSCPKAD